MVFKRLPGSHRLPPPTPDRPSVRGHPAGGQVRDTAARSSRPSFWDASTSRTELAFDDFGGARPYSPGGCGSRGPPPIWTMGW